MSARLIAYLPDSVAVEGLITTHSARVGRAPGNELVLAHGSISREHALLQHDGNGWWLRDLGSKNGCFVAGRRVLEHRWQGATWLRLGDVVCEFTPLSPTELAQAARRGERRRASSALLTQRVERHADQVDLLQATLAAVVELAGCERGFLLLAERGDWSLRARQGLDAASLRSPGFTGSIGAVERARSHKVAIVVNDVGADAALAGRASVISGGLRALVCLPLLLQDEVFGVVYADSRQAGAVITDLDLQLLSAFVERASLWIAARRAQASLAALSGEPALAWSELSDGLALTAHDAR